MSAYLIVGVLILFEFIECPLTTRSCGVNPGFQRISSKLMMMNGNDDDEEKEYRDLL